MATGYACPHGCRGPRGQVIHWETVQAVNTHIDLEHPGKAHLTPEQAKAQAVNGYEDTIAKRGKIIERAMQRANRAFTFQESLEIRYLDSEAEEWTHEIKRWCDQAACNDRYQHRAEMITRRAAHGLY